MTQPLSDVRVLDVTGSVAGPFATQILGDLGADVVKVERTSGDDTRGWGPPFNGDASVAFLALNRNKRSIAIDLRTPDGLRILERLVEQSDILIENLAPGAMRRLGIPDGRIRELNPAIVHCVITGYGDEGPLADAKAYDPLVQAQTGLMSITGSSGGDPVRVPVSILDKGAGMWAVIGILSQLYLKKSGAEVAKVSVSLLDTALNWIAPQLLGYLSTGIEPVRHGSGLAGICPYGAFSCSDGFIMITAGNDAIWSRLCGVLSLETLLDDERFGSNASRVKYRTELEQILNATLARKTVDEWLAQLKSGDVPCARICSIADIANDTQVRASHSVVAESDSHGNSGQFVRSAMRLAADQETKLSFPPRLGEHGPEILAALGFDATEIDRLEAAGVVTVTASYT